MDEALALGWKVDGSMESPSEDELTLTGTATLTKDVGIVRLYLDIPFRAELVYGKPESPMARIGVIEGEKEATAALARIRAGLDNNETPSGMVN